MMIQFPKYVLLCLTVPSACPHGACALSQVTEFGGGDLYKEYKAPGAAAQSEDDDNQSEDVGSVASNAAEVRAECQPSTLHRLL